MLKDNSQGHLRVDNLDSKNTPIPNAVISVGLVIVQSGKKKL